MVRSEIKILLDSELIKVWDTVTSLDNYGWRSDISKIEKTGENKFTEYTENGFATNFTVTAKERFKRWEFDIDNSNIKGHWTGMFFEKDGRTEVIFTEEAEAKKLFMKPLVKMYLKKQQEQYVSDLRKVLETT